MSGQSVRPSAPKSFTTKYHHPNCWDSDNAFKIQFFCGVPDDAVDGIAADIDGRMIAGEFVSDACIFSDNFTDEVLAGTTFGRIVTRDGLTLEVTDAPDPADGVHIAVSGTDPAAEARVRVCSGPETDFHRLHIGDEIIVTCGSASVQVVSGPVTATFDTIEAEFPTETAVTVTEVEPGTFDVSNSPESAAPITVGGLVVEPGETATVSDGDGDGCADVVDPAPLSVTGEAKPTLTSAATIGRLIDEVDTLSAVAVALTPSRISVDLINNSTYGLDEMTFHEGQIDKVRKTIARGADTSIYKQQRKLGTR